MSHEIRFWSKVKIGLKDECWEWQAALFRNGYGAFRINGQTKYAHRYAYLYSNGAIRSDLVICHSCDNRRCCNPQHLIESTQQFNLRDAYRKGRMPVGEQKVRAKLKDGDIPKIREMLRAGIRQKDIALLYGVSRSSILQINLHRAWNHVRSGEAVAVVEKAIKREAIE